MKFLCLGYLDTAAFDGIPEAQRRAVLEECMALCVPFRASGRVRMEEGLERSSLARTLRPGRSGTEVRSGPLLESRVQPGAFFVLEAEDMDEAVRVALLHPSAKLGAEFGFAIEIWPIQP